MPIERAEFSLVGILFIVVAIIAQVMNSMRKGEPPTAPPPRPPRPEKSERPMPRPQPEPVWRPEPVVVARPEPTPYREVPAPAPVAVSTPDPDAAELHNLLARLRQADQLRADEDRTESRARSNSITVDTAVTIQAATANTLRLQSVLRNRTEARRAILLAEVLQPPLALRNA
ncbi:hypothetical protein SAMN05444156_1609 [Verrucomicrobium sp. GAS474]|uniref:hypothetical protein n=1 Tax=Verrucomicrobium sp. GAS474 TaxID=1882831 RepID=UPI00087C622C|nr:hypothetical protein [Verrucomicrobium sp. GAS474]SDU04019.1 hypothetical protein SAMN05444156_1609 [Verrucomicrobium sp. GAS474]